MVLTSFFGCWLKVTKYFCFQGICPGNRLRIMNSYDSGCFSMSSASSPCQSLAASTATLNSSIFSSDNYENTSLISKSQQLNQQNATITSNYIISTYSRSDLQRSTDGQGNRRSWHASPHKVTIKIIVPKILLLDRLWKCIKDFIKIIKTCIREKFFILLIDNW